MIKSGIKSIKVMAMFGLLALAGCAKDKVTTTETFTVYDAVYMSKEDVRKAPEVQGPAAMLQPGKIYIFGQYLFVSEQDKGIHIIDNSNPASPQRISFLAIAGNVDMAVKGDYLYADSYMDLLVFNISDPQGISLERRINDAWPRKFPFVDGFGYVVGYNERKVVTVTDQERQTWIPQRGGLGMEFWTTAGGDVMTMGAGGAGLGNGNTRGGGSDQVGKGGSMARFTIYGKYLYVIDNSSIYAYNVTDAANPAISNGDGLQIGMEIETLFPAKGHLFIGTSTGLLVYSVADPARPKYTSNFSHARACDPVVVYGDKAYVTLRSGNRCAGTSNQLDVLDVKDINRPKLIKTYEMTNPAGLGIDNHTLFLCDGTDGLKVFDIEDENTINEHQLGHYQGMEAYDVIPYNNTLILTSRSGIYQYDYSDPKNLKLLSKLFGN